MKKTMLLLALTLSLTAVLKSETAIIPGNVNSLCYFDNFFYNLPENDFLYYFNDALLYTEPPDDDIYSDGMRDKFLRLVGQHRLVKEYILKSGNRQNATITIDLKTEDGFKAGLEFMGLLGLDLKKNTSAVIQIKPRQDDETLNYYNFCGLKVSALQTQLNSTGIFFFKLRETAVPLPWSYRFLNDISGGKLDSESFFEQMIANKRLSILLAVLFRLADNEIAFVNQALPKAPGSAWKRIFLDKKMLMGMLVLSNALRVQDGRLFFPGGDKAKKFWTALVGIDPELNPFDFLTALSSRDYGKLNYLFVFSFFLQEERRSVLFFDYDAAKIRRLYQKIILGENERIKVNSFPRLDNFNYYTLLLALKIRDHRLVLPLGVDAWAQAMELEMPAQADEFDFLESLLAASGKNGRKASLLQRFITLYSKFHDRPWFLTQDFLKKAFADFESKNVLLDFIEKIPLKKTESADALFAWQDSLLKLNRREQILFTALGQSLLEIISHMAWFAPERFDYDAMIGSLLAIPWQRAEYYDRVFDFIKEQSGMDSLRDISDESFLAFVLSGLKNQTVSVHGESYDWLARDMYTEALSSVLTTQEDSMLSVLTEINGLLKDLADHPDGFNARAGRRLLEAIEQLPYPDFSKSAPKSIKDRVLAYSKSDLDGDVLDLLKMSEKKTGPEEIKEAIDKIKSSYLLPNLKDFFLSLAYALNAKNPKLRIFMNPNLTRLHDFSDSNGSPWSNNSAPGNKAEFSGFHFKGGLSRLNITFAFIWRNQLFDKRIYNSDQAQGMIYNITAMLPQSPVNHSARLDALLVEFAGELLQKCSGDEKLKNAVSDAAMTLTTGYHYRRLQDFLSGRAVDYYLFFCELRQIGLYFFNSGSRLDDFSHKEALAKYAQMPLSAIIANESDSWGNIQYSSLGSLRPMAGVFLPQEIAQLFASGWISGEWICEYKIKAAYLAYKNDFPFCLLGQFIFDYTNTVCKSIYAQNHLKDYHNTFFVLDVMNSAHLKNALKKLQKDGFLRLK